jgi:hypothetical protein
MPPDETVAPIESVYERLGLTPPRLIRAGTTAHNLRRIVHVADDGSRSHYVNVSDLLGLLDHEYQITESREIGGFARMLREVVGE